MLLDSLSLLDEGVLGRSKAALQSGAEDGCGIGGTQLGSQARRRAEELSLGKHRGLSFHVLYLRSLFRGESVVDVDSSGFQV